MVLNIVPRPADAGAGGCGVVVLGGKGLPLGPSMMPPGFLLPGGMTPPPGMLLPFNTTVLALTTIEPTEEATDEGTAVPTPPAPGLMEASRFTAS